jgi:Protein of unknown function (DUF4232)
MKSSARAARRAALAVAIAGVTALGVTALGMPTAGMTTASAAGRQPASHKAGVPACTTSQLTIWLGVPGDGTAGGVFYQLEFSNVSHTTCYLMGFPAVTAVNGTTQLGLAASQDHMFAVRKRVLARGATAHAVLKITDPGAIGCPSADANGLRIVPPNDSMAAFVPLDFTACTGNNRNLAVRAVRARTGIPGYGQ